MKPAEVLAFLATGVRRLPGRAGPADRVRCRGSSGSWVAADPERAGAVLRPVDGARAGRVPDRSSCSGSRARLSDVGARDGRLRDLHRRSLLRACSCCCWCCCRCCAARSCRCSAAAPAAWRCWLALVHLGADRCCSSASACVADRVAATGKTAPPTGDRAVRADVRARRPGSAGRPRLAPHDLDAAEPLAPTPTPDRRAAAGRPVLPRPRRAQRLAGRAGQPHDDPGDPRLVGVGHGAARRVLRLAVPAPGRRRSARSCRST